MARLTSCIVIGVGAVLALGAQPVAASQSLGFAVSWFGPAFNSSDTDCAGGPNEELKWEEILTKRGLPQKRIRELVDDPANAQKFLQEVLHRGRNGEDVCKEPEADYTTPPWKTVTGKASYGANLDGTADGAETATTCKHQKFVGLDGAPGVDNQLYRVMGCSKGHLGQGKSSFVYGYANDRMKEGMLTFLIEISGIDDLKNDPQVTLTFYKGIEPLKKDANGEVLADATFHVASDPRAQFKAQGAIKDGVLTTAPVDFQLEVSRAWQPPLLHFSGARFNARITEDRALKAVMVGYQEWLPYYFSITRSAPLYEKFTAGNCPGLYRAFKEMADGGKDPKTGQCSMISSAYNIEAVPAFLVHPEESKTAEARPVRTTQTGVR
jgi:hypothetical protein